MTGERTRERIAPLDGLRALALGGVVVFHLFGISGVLTTGGDSLHERLIWTIFGNTLDIFFILSGFVLFLPILAKAGKMDRLGDFYLKRLSRIQPEYWLCLVVVVLMIGLIPVGFEPAMPTFGYFLLHVFDLQTAARMFSPESQVGFWIDGALWLVPVIVGLYLVFPLLARLFLKLPWLTLLLAAAVTVAWKLAPVHFPGLYESISGHVTTDENLRIIALDQSPAYLFSFTLGLAAARIYFWARNNPDSPWIARGVILAFVIGIPAYFLLSLPYTDAALQTTTGFDGSSRGRGLVFDNMGASTVRTMLILGVILGPLWLQRPFTGRPVKWIADQSYGIYLIHLPIAFYISQLIVPPQNGSLWAFSVWCLLLLSPAAVYAWLSRRFVGRPAIDWTTGWIERRRRKTADSETAIARFGTRT
ncbi:MAG: acyltransferase [Solirubrobacterales bacterium]|nr:acyltransferase [Solirubrobacterales bacterium]